jgi:hypothetical protein
LTLIKTGSFRSGELNPAILPLHAHRSKTSLNYVLRRLAEFTAINGHLGSKLLFDPDQSIGAPVP